MKGTTMNNTVRITRPTHGARIRLHERRPDKALRLQRRIVHADAAADWIIARCAA